MKHLMRILEVQHLRDGKVIWEAKNLPNTFHLDGEEFMLTTNFKSTGGITVPSFYYLGLDNRSTVLNTDNMASVTSEPTGNGYSRQPISSATGFTIEQYTRLDASVHWQAISSIVAFSASGSQWGPVTNVFLTNAIDGTGYLISTAPLGVTRNVEPGEAITFRFALSLADDPTV